MIVATPLARGRGVPVYLLATSAAAGANVLIARLRRPGTDHLETDMPMLLRHLVSILLLPGVVAVAVPAWLLTARGDTRWTDDAVLVLLARTGGAALIAAGAALFLWCVALFARVGRGTLAPWDPTRRLVAVGPYRVVRNPMIVGVALTLAGQVPRWLPRRRP